MDFVYFFFWRSLVTRLTFIVLSSLGDIFFKTSLVDSNCMLFSCLSVEKHRTASAIDNHVLETNNLFVRKITPDKRCQAQQRLFV